MKTLLIALLTATCLTAAETDDPIVLNDLPSLTLAQPDLTLNELQPVFKPKEKSLFWSVGLSVLFPGLGHIYLEDPKTAAGLFGSASLALTAAAAASSEDVFSNSLVLVQNISAYGIYAAYRDARTYNGQSNYSYKMPIDSLTDLTYAPFNYKVLRKPEVWGGFLGAFATAALVGYLMGKTAHIALSSSSSFNLSPLAAFPVAIGEEALFRGYLQTQLSESFSPVAGIALSSLLFGAAHIPNAEAMDPSERRSYYTFGIPFITAFGTYFGWMAYKNRSLKEGVALHSWYDFCLFAAALASPKAAALRPTFALSLPF